LKGDECEGSDQDSLGALDLLDGLLDQVYDAIDQILEKMREVKKS